MLAELSGKGPGHIVEVRVTDLSRRSHKRYFVSETIEGRIK